jgi:cytoskeletal protein CcmA (bactofilin family)
VQVDGYIEGDVKTRLLTVGEDAHICGAIEAEVIRVRGAVTGPIHARNVVLTKTSKVTGDIVHESLTIEAGAHVEGNFRRFDSRPPLHVAGEDTVSLIQSTVPNPLVGRIKNAASK